MTDIYRLAIRVLLFAEAAVRGWGREEDLKPAPQDGHPPEARAHPEARGYRDAVRVAASNGQFKVISRILGAFLAVEARRKHRQKEGG